MRIDVLRSSAGRVPHLGEEAELRGLLQELARRGIEGVVVDRGEAPRHPVSGAAPVGQDPPGAAAQVPPDEAGQPAPEAEGLLLSGAGSDGPAGPELLADWLGAARTAARHGRPVVISGLALDARNAPAEVLRELLGAASLVGLRDGASRALALRLCPDHPGLHLGEGDILVLPTPDTAAGPAPEGAPPRIVAALGHLTGPFGPDEAAPVLTALLAALAHRTAGAVAVLPCGGARADAEFAEAVAAGLPESARPHVRVLDAAADALVLAADHLVTTCPRAVALGLAGGADVLPVGAEKYATERMEAVLHCWGLTEHVVPLAALLTPGATAWDTRAAVQQWATEAVEQRAAVRSALAEAVPALHAAGDRWWDGVVEALRGGEPQRLPSAAVAPRRAGAPVVRSLRRRYATPAAPAARPTVAVVLRTRGRPAVLSRALDDVLAQTFTDWRLVVVDDGGDPAVVDRLLAERQDELAGRATVLHHRRGLGPGAAANRGLRAADSELVVLRDDPEPWSPTFLQRAVARLEDPLTTDDGVVVHAEAGGPATSGPVAPTLTGVLGGERAVPGSFVYRRAVHGVLGDYDESLAAAVDWEFALRFLETFTVGLVRGHPHPVRARGNEGSGAGSALRGRDELLVRERHLKQWTGENGIGLPLYLSREIREQAAGLHARLDGSEALARELLELVREQSARIEQLERAVLERGFAAFWRRVWRAVRGR
ncbi:glycosyltransferase [Kocuria sabuli]|uniref:glycosyltransferase n=1 Tax=Kocuria sabuli TaxID=3071448 RepID=UPI0034D3EC82